jgi:hypothetical protein
VTWGRVWARGRPSQGYFVAVDRLVVSVDFEKAIVWIKWIGSHSDYDKIDVKELRHGD